MENSWCLNILMVKLLAQKKKIVDNTKSAFLKMFFDFKNSL